jgi:hypothetical protein
MAEWSRVGHHLSPLALFRSQTTEYLQRLLVGSNQ